MEMINTHLLLVSGADQDEACERVRLFYAKNFLVKYNRVTILEERILAATDGDFWKHLNDGIRRNRRAIRELLTELQENGYEKLPDLVEMEQGYDSKVLHTVTHLLDGFFGVDTFFYNLEADSHDLSERLAGAIRAQPNGFWLVETECKILSGHQSSQLDLIRKFDVTPPKS
jgi:hypothetical protein